ncbi:MAG: beta-lactamase family protein [Myxococcales bacterium]|nr:beta-lactamase family protein [Myxococcales bacterium]
MQESPSPPALLPLPSQPEHTPWPTQEWPRGELDPRVDRAGLEKRLDHAFGGAEPEDLERTHSVAIVQHGRLVVERHGEGAGPNDAFASWSMAKSITSALVGILVRQGRLDISEPIPVKEWSADDPRAHITIDQMLRMVDGLRFREAEHLGGGAVRYYPEEESDVIPMLFGAGKADVAAFAAGLPKVADPETRWNYNSGGSNLLARLVGETVGGGADEMLAFMKRELFDPLGMRTPNPKFDKAGHFIGASACPSSALDFARFGLLYLRDGVWDGTRILPEGWVDYSRTPSPQSDGLYGAHFWVTPGSLGIFSCQGAWGQRTLIVPRLDLVVVRLGQTAPHKVGAVVQYCKELVDTFRPTA